MADISSDAPYLNAVAVRAALGAGLFSAVEYVSALLDRIEAMNGSLHAFLSVVRKSALADAKAADRRRLAGAALPPLHGLPFAVKDLFDVRGLPTSAHSRVPSALAKRSAAAVTRIEQQGGILIGKLGLEEFGIGSSLDDLAWPSPRNPWDVMRTAGGSSSGSAVALAAGMVPLALGTDTGGSVRAPAAYCGLVALKPTANAIDPGGVMPLSRTLDAVGPMARSAKDCALLFTALTGRKSAVLPAECRIGLIDTSGTGRAPDAAMLIAIKVLASLGNGVGNAEFPHFGVARTIGRTILLYEAFAIHRDRLARFAPLYGQRCRNRLEAGSEIGTLAYASALEQRELLRTHLDVLLQEFDVLALPVTFGAASSLDTEAIDRSGDVTFRLPFNITGHPAIVFCTGFDEDGMPLSMQLVGRHGDDERLLALVERYQELTGWHKRHPRLYGGA